MKSISGRHLIIDAYVEDGTVLDDHSKLCDMFDELVKALDMEYLQRPSAIRVPCDPAALDTDDDDGGWSVACQITTSHIALHGWPQRNAFMMDVFSCHDFDVERAQRIIWERLGVTDANVRDLHRSDPRQQAHAQSRKTAA
jgi:S-adenosylmethionine decarboxylase